MSDQAQEYIDCTLLNQLPAGVLLLQLDDAFTVSNVNDEFMKMFGYSLDNIMEKFNGSFMKLIHPVDYVNVANILKTVDTEKESFRCRVMNKDGTYWWVLMNVKQVLNANGCKSLLCILINLPDTVPVHQVQVTSQLQIDKEQTSDIVFEWNILDDTMFYSENWMERFGYKPILTNISNSLLYTSHIHEADRQTLESLIKDMRNGKPYSVVEMRIKDIELNDVWCRLRATNQFDESGKPMKVVGIISDINDEKSIIDDLRRRAERDALTGLYNRDETETQIMTYLQNHANEKGALLIIDTDDFKSVNDTQGHLFGDAVLCEMAAKMKKITREKDIVGRIGGDEFIVFLKNITSKEAIQEKVKELLESFQKMFKEEKHSIEVTCSVGVSLFPSDSKNFTELYKFADMALYQAKGKGKNQFSFYDEKMIQQIDYSSVGTRIDSDVNSVGVLDDLVNYVFQILFDSQDINHSIQLILEIIGKRFDVSRAYIFENSTDGKYVDNTYEWCNEGIFPQIDSLQHFPYETVAGYEDLFHENSIFYCRDIYTLSPDKIALFESQGICSTLQCALRDDDKFCGFVGFDECTGMRLWTKEEIGVLSLISQMLAIFLQKKRKDTKEYQLAIKLNTILDTQDAYIYVIDRNSYEILYTNHKMKELESSLSCRKCYELFFNRHSVCDCCPIVDGVSEIYNKKYDIWMKVQAVAIFWGEQEAYLVTCYDISEYKRLQNK